MNPGRGADVDTASQEPIDRKGGALLVWWVQLGEVNIETSARLRGAPCVAVCCSGLQRVAVDCIVLQRTAACCKVKIWT